MPPRRSPLTPKYEADIVAAILRYLRGLPETWAQKMHGSVFQDVGTPDLLGVHRGTAFAFEVKRVGGKATKAQTVMLARWRAAGAITGVVHSIEDVQRLLADQGYDPAG